MFQPGCNFAQIARGAWNTWAVDAVFATTDGDVEGVVTIVGPPGSDRSRLLSAAATKLLERKTALSFVEINDDGTCIVAITPADLQPSKYVVIDDLDRASTEAQRILVDLIDHARSTGATVIASLSDLEKLCAPLRRRVAEGLVIRVHAPPAAA